MTVLRNGLAALAAILLMAMLYHVAAPALAEHLPGKDAVSAVLGLATVLLPIVYKLLDAAMAALRFGRPAPANSRWVSVLAGAAILALISGAFVFVMTYGLQQALIVARGAPAAESVLHMAQDNLAWLKLALLLLAALLIGSWTGRRHGFVPIVVVGFSLLGWIVMLGIEGLSKTRDMAAVHGAFHALMSDPSLATLQATTLPMLLAILVLGLVGGVLGGGTRARNSRRDFRPLHLGGE